MADIPKSINMATAISQAMTFKSHLQKAKEWLSQNQDKVSHGVKFPAYWEMSRKEKRHIDFLTIKDATSVISNEEKETIAEALIFEFVDKADFVTFVNTMDELNIKVYAVCPNT